MAGNYKFSMDQKDMVRFLTGNIGSFIQDRLINKEQRIQHKEQCAERLAAEDGSCERGSEVWYSDQAVLANLDWGMDALEEAINTSNIEAKFARLDHAEKMLQVCAMLDTKQKTGGVPNFYLSAWSHLNLAYLWKLRNNVHNAVLHILKMFMIDPFFSRVDFTPELWKALFLPHMSSIVGWYSEARHRLVMDVIPDSTDLSFTADLDQFFNESLVFSMRLDQAEKMQKLEQRYGQSLDENTRMYSKYYKDCIKSDSATSKKALPMVPIAEPPATPLHEMSRSIPDYVKFGPILPKSAGFSPFLKDKEDEGDNDRLNITSPPNVKHGELARWSPKAESIMEDEDDCGPERGDADTESEAKTPTNSMRNNNIGVSVSKVQQLRKKGHTRSPMLFSPIDSPKTPSPKSPSLKQSGSSKKDVEPIVGLLSNRLTDPTASASLPLSPQLYGDSSLSPESDSEVKEKPKSVRKNLSSRRSVSFDNVNTQILTNSSLNEYEVDGSHSTSVASSGKTTPLNRPPKDFMCPITSQFLIDPVTLEIG